MEQTLVTLKPLRGSARGRVLKALLLDHLGRLSVCRLEEVVADFDGQYTPPMPNHNAVSALKQLVYRGQVVKLGQGVYGAAGDKGDLLPRLKAVHPIAYQVYEAMDTRGTKPWPTRLIPDTVHRLTGKRPTRDQLYRALNVLEENGVVRWTKSMAALSKATAGGAKLLNGARPMDVIRSANVPIAPDEVDAQIDADLRRLRPRRDADDNVIDPLDESQDAEAVDTTAPAGEPDIFA